jgi:hypothetical protein
MKTLTKKMLTTGLGLMLVTSVAWSDTLLSICQVCNQIPKPKVLCLQGEEPPEIEFCGAEAWLRINGTECKLFETITVYCANGKKMKYTDERWFGAGSTCDPLNATGNHHCY